MGPRIPLTNLHGKSKNPKIRHPGASSQPKYIVTATVLSPMIEMFKIRFLFYDTFSNHQWCSDVLSDDRKDVKTSPTVESTYLKHKKLKGSE